MDAMPPVFDHEVPVPGLVDLATPAFVEVGNAKSAGHRQAFWYRSNVYARWAGAGVGVAEDQ